MNNIAYNGTHFQSENSRINATNNFCKAVSFFSIPNIFMYLYIKMYVTAIIVASISMLFYGFVLLNERGYHGIAKTAIIALTNIGIGVFSIYLGFQSGFYLNIFASPFLVYVLFDYTKKSKIYLYVLSYLFTFFVVFIVYWYDLYTPLPLTKNILSLLYVINFATAFLICFGFIIYFSNNNARYILLLIESNEAIKQQQLKLEQKIIETNNTNNELLIITNHKDVLLSETHHRVKNNLAVVSGLIELQSFYSLHENSHTLIELKNRIKIIALLHEKLYANNNFEIINSNDYLNELIALVKSSNDNCLSTTIKITTAIQNIELNLQASLPFAMLVHELLSNSYKHAFKNRLNGNINIILAQQNEEYYFEYRDDGVGFNEQLFSTDTTLGLNLITAFATQLNARHQFYSKLNKGIQLKLWFKA